jgi:hypothetical protein
MRGRSIDITAGELLQVALSEMRMLVVVNGMWVDILVNKCTTLSVEQKKVLNESLLDGLQMPG